MNGASLTKYRLVGSDQALNGLNFIGKAALNILEFGRLSTPISTAVAEKRLYVGHEQIGFIEEIVCLRKL